MAPASHRSEYLRDPRNQHPVIDRLIEEFYAAERTTSPEQQGVFFTAEDAAGQVAIRLLEAMDDEEEREDDASPASDEVLALLEGVLLPMVERHPAFRAFQIEEMPCP